MTKREIAAVILLFLGVGCVFEIPFLVAGQDVDFSWGSSTLYWVSGVFVLGMTCFITALLLLRSSSKSRAQDDEGVDNLLK